jgi:hypothetical protein
MADASDVAGPVRASIDGRRARLGPEDVVDQTPRSAQSFSAPLTVGARVRQCGRWLSRHAWVLTAALCLVVLVVGLRGGDLAAQDYRVWAFRTHGFLLWDVGWYAGSAAIGYSVLFPAVASVAGASVTAAVACVCSTAFFGRLVSSPTSRAAAISRLWFAVFVLGDLVAGRAPFACSVACALGAIVAVTRKRPWLAGAASVLASLFSPLGAMFLLLAAVAWTRSLGWRRTAPLAGGLCGIAISLAGGDGGLFPFPGAGLAVQLAIVTAGLVLTPRAQRTIRRGLALYGLACVVFFLIPNPVGGNIVRMAGLLIGPIAAYVLLTARRERVLLAVAGPLLVFQLQPVVFAAAWASDDPSSRTAYYDGMLGFLETHQTPNDRVEIPFTRGHWEATFVAEHVDLARGWYRQLDLARNAILYAPLTDLSYRAWLDDNAVRYVALPDVALDPGGTAEAALLQHPPAWLRLVYTDANWHVWEVTDPTPIAQGGGSLSELGPDTFTISTDQPGATLVRVRWSRYWHVEAGDACLGRTTNDWTLVDMLSPGSAQISARIRLGADDRCTDAQFASAWRALMARSAATSQGSRP